MAILIGAPTPLTISVSSGNAIDHVNGTISHAVSHSSNPGAAASLLSTDSNGYIRIVRIGLGKAPAEAVDVVGNIQLTGRIKHTDDLIIEPAGNDVLFQDADIQAHNWVSGTTGWGIQRDGNADFRNLTADSLTVEAFISDVNLALAGSQFVTKSLGILARAFTVPTTSETLYVLDLPGYENTAVFENGDYVRLRYVDRSGGGLVVGDAWGTVSSYSDLSGGEQSWTWTRVSGSVGQIINAGMIALDYGQSGDGYVHTTTLDAAGSPYLEIGSWATDPSVSGNHTVHLRIGQLDGVSGVGDEWGLWAGQSAYKYLLMSDQNAAIHGLRLSLYDGSNLEALRLDPDVPSLAVGQPLPTGPAAGGDGFWAGLDGGSYKLRIGKAAGPALHWTGAAVELRDNAGQAVIVLDSSSSYFAKPMTLGSNGGIWQGTGSFASPTTGLKIWNDSGYGRIGGYNGGTVQWYAATDGKLYAGAGDVLLDANGITIKAGALINTRNEIRWLSGASEIFTIGADTAGNIQMFGNGTLSLAVDAYSAGFQLSGTSINYYGTLKQAGANKNVYAMHPLITPIYGSGWTGSSKSASTTYTIDVDAVFSGVPSQAQALQLGFALNVSSSGRVRCGSTSADPVHIDLQAPAGWSRFNGMVAVNNGNIYFRSDVTVSSIYIYVLGYYL